MEAKSYIFPRPLPLLRFQSRFPIIGDNRRLFAHAHALLYTDVRGATQMCLLLTINHSQLVCGVPNLG